MTARPAPLTGGEFSLLFERFQYSAYRLETLPAYQEPTEAAAVEDFLAGRTPEVFLGKRRWLDLVRRARDARKVMQRVHVISMPVSPYLDYEITWSYKLNVAAGEDVRLLPLQAGVWPVEVPRSDYWLFDSRQLVCMNYTEDGRLLGTGLASDPGAVAAACFARDAALHRSVAYLEYMGTQPSLRVH